MSKRLNALKKYFDLWLITRKNANCIKPIVEFNKLELLNYATAVSVVYLLVLIQL